MSSNIAVITGASGGIGHATALKLSNRFKVIGLSRRIVEGIDSLSVDVSDPVQIERAFRIIAEKYGVPKVLINCAGTVEPRGLLEIPFEEWQETISVNLTGIFLCTQQFAKYARSHGGKIINVSSTAGTRPQPGWSAYAASKAGVINFSLTMSEELKPYNIKVYCLAPGRCATKLRRKLAPDEDQSLIMQPGEVAELIFHLSTSDNLLDGQVLTVRRSVHG